MARPKASAAPVNSVEKPLYEEFLLDPDFTSIAEALGAEVDEIFWSVTDTETTHILSGSVKA